MANKRKRKYINNADLMEHLKQYKKDLEYAKNNGLEKPRIPNYIGEAILLIATNLSKKINFYRYSYRDEMISDGIENCCKYIGNFNTEKYNNPHAYITTICFNAARHRINVEKKQTYIKSQIVKNSGIIDTLNLNLQDNDECNEINTYLKFLYEYSEVPAGLNKKEKKEVIEEIKLYDKEISQLMDAADSVSNFEEEQEIFDDVRVEDYLYEADDI